MTIKKDIRINGRLEAKLTLTGRKLTVEWQFDALGTSFGAEGCCLGDSPCESWTFPTTGHAMKAFKNFEQEHFDAPATDPDDLLAQA